MSTPFVAVTPSYYSMSAQPPAANLHSNLPSALSLYLFSRAYFLRGHRGHRGLRKKDEQQEQLAIPL